MHLYDRCHPSKCNPYVNNCSKLRTGHFRCLWAS